MNESSQEGLDTPFPGESFEAWVERLVILGRDERYRERVMRVVERELSLSDPGIYVLETSSHVSVWLAVAALLRVRSARMVAARLLLTDRDVDRETTLCALLVVRRLFRPFTEQKLSEEDVAVVFSLANRAWEMIPSDAWDMLANHTSFLAVAWVKEGWQLRLSELMNRSDIVNVLPGLLAGCFRARHDRVMGVPISEQDHDLCVILARQFVSSRGVGASTVRGLILELIAWMVPPERGEACLRQYFDIWRHEESFVVKAGALSAARVLVSRGICSESGTGGTKKKDQSRFLLFISQVRSMPVRSYET